MIDHLNIKTNENLHFYDVDIWIDSIENIFQLFSTQEVNPNFYYVIRVKSCSESIQIDDRIFSPKENDLIYLTPYNSKIAFLTFSGLKGNVIGFSEGFYAVSYLHQNFLLESIAYYNSPIFSCENISADEILFTNMIFEQCQSLYEQQKTERKLLYWRIIRTMISNLLLFLQKRDTHHIDQRTFESTQKQNIVLEFTKLLEMNYRNESSLSFYLQKLNISSANLNNCCKSVLGISPKEVMQRKVNTEAKRLLINEDSSIQEIGYYLGFSDPSNFNKFFLKKNGITPKQFRQQRALL